MAQRIVNTDDLTGDELPDGTPTTTVTITVDDSRNVDMLPSFEIDLTDTNLKALIKALNSTVSKYASKGREVAPTKRATVSADAEEAKAARAWAIATNLQPPVSARGAVPQRCIDAYRLHLEQNATATGE